MKRLCGVEFDLHALLECELDDAVVRNVVEESEGQINHGVELDKQSCPSYLADCHWTQLGSLVSYAR